MQERVRPEIGGTEAGHFDCLEMLPVATICFGTDGSFLFANYAFQTLCSLSRSELEVLDAAGLKAHLLELEAQPARIAAEGVFGAAVSPQANLRHLKDGRVVEVLYQQLSLPELGDINVQHWVDHSTVGRAFREIETELDLLLKLINQVPDQIYFKDLESRFTRINPALARRYGLDSAAEAIGKSDADFYSAEHAKLTRGEELEMMQQRRPVFNQLHHEHWGDGRDSWNVCTKMPIYSAEGDVIGIAGISHDVTEHKRREADAWNKANYDGLTRLANRNFFLESLHSRLIKARNQHDNFAVLLLDLDRFKEVNDTLGHSQGDQLLVQVAQRITGELRDTDLVGRLGGDEFAIIMELSDAYEIRPLLNRLLERIEQPVVLGHEQVAVSASIGVAIYPQDADSAEALLARADEAMYSTKDQGRAGYTLYSAALSATSKHRLRLASDLRSAIDTEQIQVEYQPVVAAKYDRIVGAEALCRWYHPELGPVSPEEFIPIAEQTGLIQRLEDKILDTAIQQLAWVNRSGVSPVRISVNISPRRIMREPQRLFGLEDELQALGVYQSQLVLEVTEGLLLDASDDVLSLFNQLSTQGFTISLDDFGTGYGALTYLMNLDIHQVKIDRSFVKRIESDASSQALCAGIISLARTLGLTVVAEGVETESQQLVLQGLDCDYLQGYLFGRSMSAEAFIGLLEDQSAREKLNLDT